jgi:hypothetical protein
VRTQNPESRRSSSGREPRSSSRAFLLATALSMALSACAMGESSKSAVAAPAPCAFPVDSARTLFSAPGAFCFLHDADWSIDATPWRVVLRRPDKSMLFVGLAREAWKAPPLERQADELIQGAAAAAKKRLIADIARSAGEDVRAEREAAGDSALSAEQSERLERELVAHLDSMAPAEDELPVSWTRLESADVGILGRRYQTESRRIQLGSTWGYLIEMFQVPLADGKALWFTVQGPETALASGADDIAAIYASFKLGPGLQLAHPD